MKHLKSFNELNESIFGDIARLNPDRKENDNKFLLLVNEIKEDFENHNKDLRKISIIDDGGSKININEISIGQSYRLSYVFGKFHTIHRNLRTGNVKDWDRRITINNVPFFITLRKNELEKAFNTKRFNLSKTSVKDVTKVPNYDRNPRIPGKQHLHNNKIDEYKISYDLALDLFKYFIEEYNSQFPELKSTKYKNPDAINYFKKGVMPVERYIDIKLKDGSRATYGLNIGENEKEIRNIISKMNREEYDNWSKERNKERYKPFDEYNKKRKDKWSVKIDKYLKKRGIILKKESEWEPYGFNLQLTDDTMRIQFRLHKDKS